jgi:hypothetical protein
VNVEKRAALRVHSQSGLELLEKAVGFHDMDGFDANAIVGAENENPLERGRSN